MLLVLISIEVYGREHLVAIPRARVAGNLKYNLTFCRSNWASSEEPLVLSKKYREDSPFIHIEVYGMEYFVAISGVGEEGDTSIFLYVVEQIKLRLKILSLFPENIGSLVFSAH